MLLIPDLKARILLCFLGIIISSCISRSLANHGGNTTTPVTSLTPLSTTQLQQTKVISSTEINDIITSDNEIPLFSVTAVPISPDDETTNEIRDKGLVPIEDFQGSLIGPGGYIYSIYGYTDPSFGPFNDKDELGPDVCLITVYQFDGQRNVVMGTVGTPTFPQSSRYSGYPYLCILINWDTFSQTGLGSVSEEIRKELDIRQYTSDINGNGLPEFAVFSFYCPNACDNTDMSIEFYEIQSTQQIRSLTEDLPGVLLPYAIFHSANPVALHVYDVGLEYEPHWEINTWWVYQWRDGAFVDVSNEFASDYEALIKPTLEKITSHYGEPLFSHVNVRQVDLLSPLFLYEKQGLREEAFDVFIEVTDPENWPGTESLDLCWLQYIRASISEDYVAERPYQLPPSIAYLDLHMSYYLDQITQENHDLNACKTR
jgi:hypothetical protein